MLTDRNKKYIEALIRDGDNFNYREWLREVREEEAQAKRVAAGSSSNEHTTPKPSDVVTAAEIPSPSKNPPIPLGNGQTSQDPPLEIHSPNVKTRKRKGFVQRLLQVSAVWEDFQETRARDAVYDYLRAVFSIVQHYRWKGRTKKLIRRAFEFAELQLDKNADPFAVIIRCTCEEKLDRKTISKWSRALRYVAQVKRRTPLETFMKNRGGINACANLYTQRLRQSKR